MGDSFELQIRYMLAKFVFPALEYNGWTGLNTHELHKKAEPYKLAVKEQWQRLKRSDPDLMSTLKPFVKTRRTFRRRRAWRCAGRVLSLFEKSKMHALRYAHGGDGIRAGDVLARWIGLQGLVRPRRQDGVLAHAQRAERG